MKESYKTKQRDQILQSFQQRSDEHINADQLSDLLKKEGTTIGTATIYRTLDKLVTQGALRKFIADAGEKACYQYIDKEKGCADHYHLKCTECGSLIHLECDEVQLLAKHLLASHNFMIDTTRTVIYGTCQTCIQKKEISHE